VLIELTRRSVALPSQEPIDSKNGAKAIVRALFVPFGIKYGRLLIQGAA